MLGNPLALAAGSCAVSGPVTVCFSGSGTWGVPTNLPPPPLRFAARNEWGSLNVIDASSRTYIIAVMPWRRMLLLVQKFDTFPHSLWISPGQRPTVPGCAADYYDCSHDEVSSSDD